MANRHHLAAAMRAAGHSYRAIGKALEVSAERARQMVKLHQSLPAPLPWHAGLSRAAVNILTLMGYQSREECLVLTLPVDQFTVRYRRYDDPRRPRGYRWALGSSIRAQELNEIRAWLGAPPVPVPVTSTRIARHPPDHPRTYVLAPDGTPRLCPDRFEWAEWMLRHDAERIVEKTRVGEAEVSTVFLGYDHRRFEAGPLLLFESLVFGPYFDPYPRRYCTRAEAQAGHAALVAQVRLALIPEEEGETPRVLAPLAGPLR